MKCECGKIIENHLVKFNEKRIKSKGEYTSFTVKFCSKKCLSKWLIDNFMESVVIISSNKGFKKVKRK